ncbi:Ankyrin-2 [Ooceraea biroi]|nr:Ankyrin-2 [Ooceraea biroi]
MTSAYETMIECEQRKMTTPCRSVKTCFDDCEPDNPGPLLAGRMKKIPSSLLASPIVSEHSSLEESAISSSAENILPGESYGENVNEGAREKEDNDEERNLGIFLNLISDTSEMDKSRSEEFESTSNDKCKETNGNEKKESISISTAYGTMMEGAPTCRAARQEQIREERKFKDQEKNKKNQIVLEIQMQERNAAFDGGNVHADGDAQVSTVMTDVRIYCENVAELRLDKDEGRVEDAEIITGQQDDGNKLFYDAVRSGNAKRVSALISSGCVQNLDEPDWNVSGDPSLLVAATNHYLPVLSILLASGCDPAVRSPRGETALHRVILNSGLGNMLQLVEDLLKHGCPPSVKEAGSGSTALHMLSRQLAHAPLRSLHHNFDAALKTLELLAQAGPVNAKDHQGRSALHILASSTIFDNHKTDIESLIETLLAAGVNTALQNDRGETALHESLECSALNTAMLLIPRTSVGIASRYGETPLHIASRKNHVDIVAKLLEHGEDPSTQDAGGNTPLHLASARGFHQTVSLLVTSPLAQLEKVNIDGLTALQVAAESGFINAVRLLLKAGADPSQTMRYCGTILRRHPDISLLIDHELTRRRQLAA